MRDYCQAYHGGSTRDEIDRRADQEQDRSAAGAAQQVSLAGARPERQASTPTSVLDIQDWYVKNKFTNAKLPDRGLVDYSYVEQRGAEARAVRAREQGQQAQGLPLEHDPRRTCGMAGRRVRVCQRGWSHGRQRRGAAVEIVGCARNSAAAETRVVAVDDDQPAIRAAASSSASSGRAGCGKSTLLRILAGLETQTSGTIKVDAAGWPVENAMVFQESGLFPWMSVETNVGFGLMTRGVPAAETADARRGGAQARRA